jgi:hypothetical protein
MGLGGKIKRAEQNFFSFSSDYDDDVLKEKKTSEGVEECSKTPSL